MMMEVYKIRRKLDGMFSTGGTSPGFTKFGKIWKQRGHLTSHLNQFAQSWSRNSQVYDNCELVTFELSETEIDAIPLSQYIAEREQARLQREEDRDIARANREHKARRAEYEKLKKEFE